MYLKPEEETFKKDYSHGPLQPSREGVRTRILLPFLGEEVVMSLVSRARLPRWASWLHQDDVSLMGNLAPLCLRPLPNRGRMLTVRVSSGVGITEFKVHTATSQTARDIPQLRNFASYERV